jgi:hypothetical protein
LENSNEQAKLLAIKHIQKILDAEGTTLQDKVNRVINDGRLIWGDRQEDDVTFVGIQIKKPNSLELQKSESA